MKDTPALTLGSSALVRAVEHVIDALEKPIEHVWPDSDEQGIYSACYTPSANPDELLVVVDGNALLAMLRAAMDCPNGADQATASE